MPNHIYYSDGIRIANLYYDNFMDEYFLSSVYVPQKETARGAVYKHGRFNLTSYYAEKALTHTYNPKITKWYDSFKDFLKNDFVFDRDSYKILTPDKKMFTVDEFIKSPYEKAFTNDILKKDFKKALEKAKNEKELRSILNEKYVFKFKKQKGKTIGFTFNDKFIGIADLGFRDISEIRKIMIENAKNQITVNDINDIKNLNDEVKRKVKKG